MGKILEQRITRFDGGISGDPRDDRGNVGELFLNNGRTLCQGCHKLTPNFGI